MSTDSLQTISLIPVATAVPALRFVVVNTSGFAALAGAGGNAVGVTTTASAADNQDPVSVATYNGARGEVEAAEAITIGAEISTDASGKAVVAGSGEARLGIAMTAAGADGDVIDFLLIKPGLAAS